jgi:hypothetical protein
MNLQYRIDLLSRLGEYMVTEHPEWKKAKEKAEQENAWFTSEFIDLSTKAIAHTFLNKKVLQELSMRYGLPEQNPNPRNVGIVMAGNIPLVGFHDWLCVFVSGHHSVIKTSSKDEALITHLLKKLGEMDPAVNENTRIASMLKGCDAYIATGSNNSAGYFDYYFGKYPNIIRRNRTSAAVLSGQETRAELDKLADDIFLYFGLGCRNVTKLYVPDGYDFLPLLAALRKFDYLADHHKYKNNYDYNLAIHLLNKKVYMSTPALLLVEEDSNFSPISQLNYAYYSPGENIKDILRSSSDIQCIVAHDEVPFGQAQCPSVTDYADAVDTMAFLKNL